MSDPTDHDSASSRRAAGTPLSCRYRAYVRRKVEQGLDDARRGRLIDQEELERRMLRWLSEPGEPE